MLISHILKLENQLEKPRQSFMEVFVLFASTKSSLFFFLNLETDLLLGLLEVH